MTHRSMISYIGSAMFLLAGTLSSQQVLAQNYIVYTDQVAMGSGVCKPATSSYKEQLRRQPLGIYNTGTTNAFVTCEARQIDWSGTNADVTVRLHNRSTQSQSITCTTAYSGTMLVPRTATLGADGKRMLQLYSSYGDAVHFNCNLPPETGIVNVRANGRLE